MHKSSPLHSALALVAAVASLGFATTSFAAGADAASAQALIKKSECGKCHAADKKKEGPAYKETAAKYKGKATAEDDVYKQLTTSPKVKVDGKEEEHAAVKSKDEAEIRNLARWILAQ
jgi:cytochrome c